ncbi:uncharacterized protein LOC142358008 [Convolutriloba macropyga]|uniref:uncharacterized protein LOC142358008 n=1 Tax=Convolutriloba macropyga TaxID=536237 RepID=UPI003F51EAF1
MPEVGMPLISAMLALLLICSILDTDVEAALTYKCRNGSFPVENTPPSACFAVLDPGAGPMNASEARNKCMAQNPAIDLVYVMKKSELQAVVDFAIRNGIPAAGEAGFWAHWIRFPDAPLYSNGTLSESNEDIRKNRTLFTSRFPGGQPLMPDELWRNESQPGNTMDARDEKCTAQSRLGKQPEYLGLDDYECDGHQLHFAVCQSFGIPESSL